MKKTDVEKAMRYFNAEIKLMKGGNMYSEPLPYIETALMACAKKLDELDREEHERKKAICYFEEEKERILRAPDLNGCEMTPEWEEELDMCNISIELLEEYGNE